MNKEQLAKIRDAILGSAGHNSDCGLFTLNHNGNYLPCDCGINEALAILDAALAAEPQPVAAPALDLVADPGFTIFPLAPDLPVPTYYWGGKGEIAEWMICPKCCGKFPISKETVAQLKATQPAPVAAQREWQGLGGDKSIEEMIVAGGFWDCLVDDLEPLEGYQSMSAEQDAKNTLVRLVRSIDAALKEKNHG